MSDIYDEFEALVNVYREKRNPALLPTILAVSLSIVKNWIKYNVKVPSEELSLDITLEFISRVIEDRLYRNSVSSLLNIAAEYSRVSSGLPITDVVTGGYTVHLDEVLSAIDDIKESLQGKNSYLKASILYLLQYPEEIPTFVDTNDVISSYVVLQTLSNFKIKFMKTSSEVNLDFNIPSTYLSKLLLLSGLYKRDPAVLVMLLMLKDMKSFIQFCTLFGGKSIKIPTVEEVSSIFKQTSSVIDSFEKDSMSIAEQEKLALLVSEVDSIEEINPNTKIFPILEEYFKEVIHSAIGNYSKMQDRMIRSTDMRNPDQVANTYAVLNGELKTQLSFYEEIMSTMTTVKSSSKLVGDLASTVQ